VAVSQQAFAPVNYGIGKTRENREDAVRSAALAANRRAGSRYCPVRGTCGETSGRLANSALLRFTGNDDDVSVVNGAMTVTNGLYSIQTAMTEGGRGHATGVIVLLDGKIAGGDSHFYYTGSYSAKNGKWRGELTTNQHSKSVGVLPLFGGREVTCGFMGTYSAEAAEVNGAALVGKTSVMIEAKLTLLSAL
jgi:hypothetical protein